MVRTPSSTVQSTSPWSTAPTAVVKSTIPGQPTSVVPIRPTASRAPLMTTGPPKKKLQPSVPDIWPSALNRNTTSLAPSGGSTSAPSRRRCTKVHSTPIRTTGAPIADVDMGPD